MTTAQAVPASAATTGVPAITAAEHEVMRQAAASFAAGGMAAGVPELAGLLVPGGPEAAGVTSAGRSFYERGRRQHLMVSSEGNEQEPAAGLTTPQASGRGGFTTTPQPVPASAATTGVPGITAAEHEVMRQAAASFAAAAGIPAGMPELAHLLVPGGPQAAGITSASRDVYKRDPQNQGHLMMMTSALGTGQVTRHGHQMRVAS